VLVATERKFEDFLKVGATAAPLDIPAGCIPWGDAVGWPDAPTTDGRPTHSTALDGHGVPRMAAGETMAAQQRHQDIFNTKPIYGLLFDRYPRTVSADALAELAYVLAGVGGTPWRRRWATWRHNKIERPLRLRVQPETAKCDPLRPLRHFAWQGATHVAALQVAGGAGPSEEATRAARDAADALRALSTSR